MLPDIVNPSAESNNLVGAVIAMASRTGQPVPNVNMQLQNLSAPPPSTNLPQTNPFAGADMSALEGISPQQLAAIARLFQSGALQVPMPAPDFSARSYSTAHGPQTTSLPGISEAPHPSTAREDVNMDAEEGEVDESEDEYSPAQEREFLRPPPTGPKNRSTSPRATRNSSQRQRTIPAMAVAPAHPYRPSSNGQELSRERRVSKKEAAKLFVREMVAAGYTYGDLVAAVGNSTQLASLFRESDLPLGGIDSHSLPPTNGMMANLEGIQRASSQSHLTEGPKAAATAIKRIAPVKPEPLDRSAYLAKLQAVKNKRVDVPVTANADAPDSMSAPKAVTPTQRPAATETPNSNGGANIQVTPVSSTRRTDQTELVRQRLEALRAANAEKQNRSVVASPQINVQAHGIPLQHQGDTRTFRNSLSVGIANSTSTISQGQHEQHQSSIQQQPSASSASKTPSRSFSGLPGLFMANVSPNDQGSTLWPKPEQTTSTLEQYSMPNTTSSALAGPVYPSRGPRKRAVASDFDDVASGPPPAKRQFGESRSGSEDEALVAMASDEEDDEDTDDGEILDSSAKATQLTGPPREAVALQDVASKPDAMSSSGPRTMEAIAYQMKLKEIADFKRRIAEKERKQMADGKATPVSIEATPTPATLDHTTPYPAVDADPSSIAESTASNRPGEVLSQIVCHKSSPGPDVRIAANSPAKPATPIKINHQQLKERLLQKMRAMEQSGVQMGNLGTRNSATTGHPQSIHVMSGALQPDDDVKPASIEAKANQSSPPVAPNKAQSEQDTGSEEGELDDSDSSSSDFYNDEDVLQQDDQAAVASATEEAGVDVMTADALVRHEMVESESESDTNSESDARDSQAWSSDEEGGMDSIAVGNGMSFEEQDKDAVEDDSNSMDLDSDSLADEEDMSQAEASLQAAPSRAESTVEASGRLSSVSTSSASDNGEVAALRSILGADVGSQSGGTALDDDMAPELQPSNNEPPTVTDRSQIPSKQYFTPYRSPFEGFKDYRYHPEYLNTVPGGYQSLTYTHNIDPENALCPFETAGGKCTDDMCQYQHFDALQVTDYDMISAMGTKNVPAHTPAELERRHQGLGLLIQQLQQSGSAQDARTIASNIVEYRRQFIGDPTKILKLHGPNRD